MINMEKILSPSYTKMLSLVKEPAYLNSSDCLLLIRVVISLIFVIIIIYLTWRWRRGRMRRRWWKRRIASILFPFFNCILSFIAIKSWYVFVILNFLKSWIALKPIISNFWGKGAIIAITFWSIHGEWMAVIAIVQI